ncbi:Cytochrome c biogenesis protein Ccs1 [Aquisphaera giovannonii]|uniref:Cytochrome c biogenesis protein Ccs1 n=1 Tax=Aquisphaera giovannonii TaxID=406548 RepID=A0A5B9VYI3_9BACT|nr:cytochrome c biogenesis protein ResB [Aquisphaera giovannonii]QEH33372.1 Cytochrome c biogenesis protein Ccs1 [Aquisphaera giovannonii]
MATAAKKASVIDSSAARGPGSKRPPGRPATRGGLVGVLMAIYRFLASLKLAVLGLGSLAASLAFATWLESRYSTATVQDFVYRSTWFALLLGFLAINIFCAAAIRFPWKRRQTGFVVTHLGLLVLIAGSYISFRTADEGEVVMLEGETKSQLLRLQDSVIRLREVDARTGEPGATRDFHFAPGPFAWGNGQARLNNLLDFTLSGLTDGRLPTPSSSGEVLSQPGDPVRVAIKTFYPAAAPSTVHEADPSGTPMARMQLEFKAPGMPQAREAFASEDEQWFALDRRFHRVARSEIGGREAPALIAFGYVDRPELIEDFLKPPMDAGPRGLARFRYADKSGKTRVHDLPLRDQEGKTITLPESDLSVTVEKVADFPTSDGGLFRVLGEAAVPVGIFEIRKGDGPAVKHWALASLPMIPNVAPNPDDPSATPPQPLASINLMVVPDLDPKLSGRMGQIEVLAGPDGKLSYRVFGRGKDGKTVLRSSGQVATGKAIPALGGGDMPMFINFRVDDYLPAGVTRQVYEPLYLPKAQMDQGIPAVLLELSTGDASREVWVRRDDSTDTPAFRPVQLGDRTYQVAYDVDRQPLGFQLKLDKFDVGFMPGTENATKFESQVRLTDDSQGIKERPHLISMNDPMSHRGFTFYQMRYSPVSDPETGQKTGLYQSVLHVGVDPGRPVKYAGCLLLVLGIFLQFTMKAGVFSDTARRKMEQATRRLRGPAGDGAAGRDEPERL